jgi:hypothetical protein
MHSGRSPGRPGLGQHTDHEQSPRSALRRSLIRLRAEVLSSRSAVYPKARPMGPHRASTGPHPAQLNENGEERGESASCPTKRPSRLQALACNFNQTRKDPRSALAGAAKAIMGGPDRGSTTSRPTMAGTALTGVPGHPGQGALFQRLGTISGWEATLRQYVPGGQSWKATAP